MCQCDRCTYRLLWLNLFRRQKSPIHTLGSFIYNNQRIIIPTKSNVSDELSQKVRVSSDKSKTRKIDIKIKKLTQWLSFKVHLLQYIQNTFLNVCHQSCPEHCHQFGLNLLLRSYRLLERDIKDLSLKYSSGKNFWKLKKKRYFSDRNLEADIASLFDWFLSLYLYMRVLYAPHLDWGVNTLARPY